MFFNKYITKLKSYSVSSHKAWQINDKEDVLKLDWNEATIAPSPKVKEALADYVESGFMHWYPDIDNKELRNKLANYTGVAEDNIEYFASSDALHEYIIRTFINPSDVVTMIAPTYDNFRAVAESIGAKVDYYKLREEENFEFCFSSFAEHLESTRPKIVYLCNPNNPTGTIYSVELIEMMVRRFNDVLFIIDEAYYEFTSITSAPLASMYENIIVSRTFSKAFALASFRIGYAISSAHNIKGLQKVRNPKNISSYAQIAALKVLDDVDYMKSFVDEVKRSKSDFIEYLSNKKLSCFSSKGGNFVLVKLGEHQHALLNYLENKNIFVRNYGHVDGMQAFTRFTIGTKVQMIRVKRAIDEFYEGI